MTCCDKKNDTKKQIEVGIDFGTTNCLIAYNVDDNTDQSNVRFLENKSTLCNLFPSQIKFDNGMQCFFCESSCAHNNFTIRSIKRILGLNLQEVLSIQNDLPFLIDIDKSSDNDVYIIINNQKDSKSVKDIVRAMMTGLKEIIVNYFNKIDASSYDVSAVITVPAYFDENARNIIKNAAMLAGFNVMRLINEPSAAALAYLNDNIFSDGSCDIYVVYDLGGGTFDVSILKRHNNNFFRVIGVGGDKFLGGDDIDNSLLNLICLKKNIDVASLNIHERNDLLLSIKKFKENFNESASISSVNITLEEFDAIVESIISKTIRLLKSAIERSEIKIEQIGAVILAGGSSRLDAVRKGIKNFFAKNNIANIKIFNGLNPDEIVAQGAAIHAYHLTHKNDQSIIFIDANSMHLGIEVAGGEAEVLIESGAPIPIARKSVFTTGVDNQENMRISICQGMSNKFSENSFLGEFVLKNLTSKKAGELKIEISFNIDADGILSVYARELHNHSNDDDKAEVYSLMLKN